MCELQVEGPEEGVAGKLSSVRGLGRATGVSMVRAGRSFKLPAGGFTMNSYLPRHAIQLCVVGGIVTFLYLQPFILYVGTNLILKTYLER